MSAFGVKRTLIGSAAMSAFDTKRTSTGRCDPRRVGRPKFAVMHNSTRAGWGTAEPSTFRPPVPDERSARVNGTKTRQMGYGVGIPAQRRNKKPPIPRLRRTRSHHLSKRESDRTQ